MDESKAPAFNVQRWFAEMDQFNSEPFMPEGRNQPMTPVREIFEDQAKEESSSPEQE